MIIRQRLTLQFTAIVALIFFGVLGTVYLIIRANTENEFYTILKERAYVAGYKFLEEDEANKERITSFEQRYLQSLPHEIIQVIDDKDIFTFITKDQSIHFPRELLERVRRDTIVQYREQERQFVGIYYKDNQGNFIILASAIDDAGMGNLDVLRSVLIIAFFVSLLFVFIGGRMFSHRALAPMSTIVQRVKEITASNLHLRIEAGTEKDEISELALTFNNMLQRLEQSFDMQTSFVSNASHELRTPITAIIGEIEVLLTKRRNQREYKETLNNVLMEAEQLKELMNMLLNLAQSSVLEKNAFIELIRIDELLWDVRDDILRKYPEASVKLQIHHLPENDEGLMVSANRYLLASALGNILDNAVKFSQPKPVACSLTIHSDSAVITFTDEGIGIPKNEVERLFQPFYRAQNARGFTGHGIGLALTEKVVRVHGGRVTVESVERKGTRFTVTLPIARQ